MPGIMKIHGRKILFSFLTSPNKIYLYLPNSFFRCSNINSVNIDSMKIFFVSFSTHIFFLLLLILILLADLLFLDLGLTLEAVADDDSFLDFDFDFVRVMEDDLIL